MTETFVTQIKEIKKLRGILKKKGSGEWTEKV